MAEFLIVGSIMGLLILASIISQIIDNDNIITIGSIFFSVIVILTYSIPMGVAGILLTFSRIIFLFIVDLIKNMIMKKQNECINCVDAILELCGKIGVTLSESTTEFLTSYVKVEKKYQKELKQYLLTTKNALDNYQMMIEGETDYGKELAQISDYNLTQLIENLEKKSDGYMASIKNEEACAKIQSDLKNQEQLESEEQEKIKATKKAFEQFQKQCEQQQQMQ